MYRDTDDNRAFAGDLLAPSLPRSDAQPSVTRPRSLADTGLGELYVADLISKHLFERGVLDLQEVTRLVALPGNLVEDSFALLRQQGRAEVRGAAGSGLLRFGLTERGRAAAQEALGRVR